MHHRRFSSLVGLVVGLVAGVAAVAAAATPPKIILLAGPITGHPKDTHEYEKSVILLKHLLETSPSVSGRARVEAHFRGWPENPATLDDAATIVFISDGGDRRESEHPVYVGDRFEQLGRQMERGCGVVMFHWSTFHPARHHDRITEWVGGYFDYETGPGANKWYSAIQTWTGEARPAPGDHPVTRGVRPFQIEEEFYYRIRFRDQDPRLRPLLEVRPPGESQDHAVAWAVERRDGGRGFGFTGGHFYKNWWLPDFRRLVLNAIVWSAGLDIPAGGVESQLDERFKTLILTGHHHPGHDWRALTTALLTALEQDPRCIVHVSENIEDLATERLSDYALLILNYNNWERPGLSTAARRNFTNHLAAGGGLALIHFANGAWHPSLPNIRPEDIWPEFQEHICRRVWEHRGPQPSGHDPFGPFRVEPTPTPHPITAGLEPFDTVDELYFRQAGTLPIVPLAQARSKVTGQPEPMAWAYPYGQGRVFQTVLGHADQSVRAAAALIRRGGVWAAGRTNLTWDPPVALLEKVLFRAGSPWSPEESLRRATPPPAPKPKTARRPAASATANLFAAAARKPGEPPMAGRSPATQEEKDWVDNRWSRTDVGPFLASVLRLPNGTIAKGLSIRVGTEGNASLVYDTATATLRAAWTGGFLRFDAARFGLIDAPRVDGALQFVSPAKPAWEGDAIQWRGMRRHANRVLLEYQIGGTPVRDSPWAETIAGRLVFTRTIELGPGNEELRMTLVAGDRVRVVAGTAELAEAEHEGRVIEAGFTHESNARFQATDNAVQVVFPPRTTAQRYRIYLGSRPPGTGASAVRLPVEDLDQIARPGPAQWLPTLETRGELGRGTGPFVVDTLTLPYDNPWNALMFLSGVGFTGDGAGYVCSIHGDVWRVTGIDDTLARLRWQRFATGLFQPLGLQIVSNRVCVLGRDRITVLHDLNRDGEADHYESFHDGIRTSTGGHEYVAGLEVDESGNFYYADPSGVHRVSANGRERETLATGFRNPNGVGVGPGGIVTVSPQQGNWTPSSAIVEVKRGGYYGFPGRKVTPERPLGFDPPLCWIPHSVDNSGSSQVWIPQGAWGPLEGRMLHLSWGRCVLQLVLRDVEEGVPQGALLPLPVRFLSGPMRGVFRAQDGHLYVAGSTGWQTASARDGCLQRVRFTGRNPALPVVWRAHANGLAFTFSLPLDPETAGDTGSYSLHQWNYRHTREYGSKDWSVKNPDQEGHDDVEILSAALDADGRTVFLRIDGLKPVMQWELKYNLDGAQGEPVSGTLHGSINRLGLARIFHELSR